MSVYLFGIDHLISIVWLFLNCLTTCSFQVVAATPRRFCFNFLLCRAVIFPLPPSSRWSACHFFHLVKSMPIDVCAPRPCSFVSLTASTCQRRIAHPSFTPFVSTKKNQRHPPSTHLPRCSALRSCFSCLSCCRRSATCFFIRYSCILCLFLLFVLFSCSHLLLA